MKFGSIELKRPHTSNNFLDTKIYMQRYIMNVKSTHTELVHCAIILLELAWRV